MKHVYLIPGYGIPKKIEKDENYRFYLGMVFNRIYADSIKSGDKDPLVVFSGGKTDIYKPFKRDEASEMTRLFKVLGARDIPHLKKVTRSWKYVLEKKSLSTHENLLYTKELLMKRGIRKAEVTIFCEVTRERRINYIAKRMFPKAISTTVVPIDFDLSPNRYLETEVIQKKEELALQMSRELFKHPKRISELRALMKEKLRLLRGYGPKRHAEAIEAWWRLNLEREKKGR